jgi:hypothetical protein
VHGELAIFGPGPLGLGVIRQVTIVVAINKQLGGLAFRLIQNENPAFFTKLDLAVFGRRKSFR